MTHLHPPRRAAARTLCSLSLCVAVASVAGLASPGEATACSSSGDEVRFYDAPAAHRLLPVDGVIAITTAFNSITLAEGIPGINATLERDGAPVPIELFVHDISPTPSPGVAWSHPALVVVRPIAPLDPQTAYTLRITHDVYDSDDLELTIVTGIDARQPPVLNHAGYIDIGAAEVLERACCEKQPTSCGDDYQCASVELRIHPTAAIEAVVSYEDQLQALPWVARLDAQGVPTERRYADDSTWSLLVDLEEEYDRWASASKEFRLNPKTGVHCFAAGLTDLVTGAETLATPYCVDTDTATLPASSISTSEPPSVSDCIGPWVLESEGAATSADGCRLDEGRPAPLTLLTLGLLLIARRRRSGASPEPSDRAHSRP